MKRTVFCFLCGSLLLVSCDDHAVHSASSIQHVELSVVDDGYGEYLLVPEGEFEMGDNFGEGFPHERPVHKVWLSAYYIGKYEVTNGEFKKFMDDGGYLNESYWNAGGFGEYGDSPRCWDDVYDPEWTDIAGNRAHANGGGFEGNESFPVGGVSWYEAMAYCGWLSDKTGETYRLPTEAEWEKAARGAYEQNRDNPELGHQRRFPWGDEYSNQHANVFDSGDPWDNGTTPVGYYDGSLRGDLQTVDNASPYGAYDMAGNVFEWCRDCYVREVEEDGRSSEYYQMCFDAGVVANPTGPLSGEFRILRGGDFHHPFDYINTQHSFNRNPERPEGRGINFGFRCVREK
jgi:formylglycine-generating enzyme required for sulfatase activity